MLDGRQGTLAVPKEAVDRLAMASDPEWLNSIVKLEHSGEEKYMANLEIFHYMHCLVGPSS